MDALGASDTVRYSRHILLPDFTAQHQLRLKHSGVVIIGLGGLGNPVAQYLASAGVGRLTLIDHDSIELSNLPRQPLFQESDIGKSKVLVACDNLKKLSGECKVEAICQRFDANSSIDLCKNHDLIIDCCDEPLTKREIDAAALNLKVPLICGAVSRYDGQVMVFGDNAKTRYRDLFPLPDAITAIENCETLGVWGPAAGIIGNIMAQEALRMLAFGQSPLEGKLMHFDLQTYECSIIHIPSSSQTSAPALSQLPESITLIERSHTAQLIAKKQQLVIIELSEKSPSDNKDSTVSHTLESLIWASAEWPKENPLLLRCEHGNRSLQAALILAADGFKTIYCVQAETLK